MPRNRVESRDRLIDARRRSGIAGRERLEYFCLMTTLSLTLPDQLVSRLEKASRARRKTKAPLVRECLEKQLPHVGAPIKPSKLTPGESFYDQALPILKKAWVKRGRGLRDLATHPRYLKDFGKCPHVCRRCNARALE